MKRDVPIAVRFVLVRPLNALNIGAAARALANFGFADLAFVEPVAKRWREAESAIYAKDLLAKAPAGSMEDAIADAHLVIGTASAHNRERLRTELTLPALRDWLHSELPQSGRVAVLFGSERNGLTNSELSHCHAVLRIPTEKDAPSMNLGQAVALVAYECRRLGLENSVLEPEQRLLEGRQLEGLVDTVARAMDLTGVNAKWSAEQRRERFRRGLLKWRMSRPDAAWLRGLLEKLMERACASK